MKNEYKSIVRGDLVQSVMHFRLSVALCKYGQLYFVTQQTCISHETCKKQYNQIYIV